MLPLVALLAFTMPAANAARIKDIAGLYGVSENTLSGYGLVTGLNRTGDSAQNSAAIRALSNRLQGLGMTLSDDDIKSRNVAVVMVTATLPAGSRPGSQFDITISSTGDARSLEGGVLQLTPLIAANGSTIATSYGSITVGGYSVESRGTSTVKNHPTVGTVSRGATVQVEVPNQLRISEATELEFILHEPDFTNSSRVTTLVNALLGSNTAVAVDSGTIRVTVPDPYLGRQTELVAAIESLEVSLDHIAKVVVNERTGTVVMGADITLSPVAVAHGGMTITVSQQNQVSQPSAFGAGDTMLVRNTDVRVHEDEGRVTLLKGATVGDVVSALNTLGVTPRDLIVILQSMQAAGGLHAQIETM